VKEGYPDMYIFQRQLRVVGGASAIGWAMEVTKRVQEVSDMPVALWAGRVGFPTGTIAWSTPVDGMSQLGEMDDKLEADDTLTKLIVDHGRDYVADVMPDRLAMVIHGEVTGSAPVGTYIGGVVANAAPGKWVAAGEWAPKIASMYTEITDKPVVVTATTAGNMGEFSWYVRHEDGASIDAAVTATMTHEGYNAELDNSGDLFQPGASWGYARRIV
jgi:hypothetical protein